MDKQLTSSLTNVSVPPSSLRRGLGQTSALEAAASHAREWAEATKAAFVLQQEQEEGESASELRSLVFLSFP